MLNPNEYFERLDELLIGNGSGDELAVLYSEALPSNGDKIKRVSGGSNIPEALEDIFPNPWSKRFFEDSIVDAEKMYSSVYTHYGATFQTVLIQNVRTVDKSLEHDRVSYGEVRSRNRLLGTWRTFRASGPNIKALPLPYMRMNKLRGVAKLRVDEVLLKLMEQGIGVNEIGKFTVFNLDAITNLRTSSLVEMNWLLNLKDNDVYVAHVTTPAHVRLYRKYGFEVAEEFSVPGTDVKEAVLWVRGWEFKEALRTRLKVEAIPYISNPPKAEPPMSVYLKQTP